MPNSPDIDLKITNIQNKILRVGFANILLFIGFCFGGLFYKLGILYNWPSIFTLSVIILIILFILLCYSRSISSLTYKNGQLVVTRALDEVKIDVTDIKRVSIFRTPSSGIYFVFFIKEQLIPNIFFFSSPYTNYGGLERTAEKLRTEFNKLLIKR